eukprot:SM000099S25192  [mRNA]  locus=s99:59636:61366:+ [translate_table: standard]
MAGRRPLEVNAVVIISVLVNQVKLVTPRFTDLRDGPCCVWLSLRMSRVVINANLNGTISPMIGNLTGLTCLHLCCNNLTGSIPSTAISKLSKLVILILDYNGFTGTLPSNILGLSSPFYDTLQKFQVAHNKLTGNIPDDYGHNSPLTALDFSYNNFTGYLPYYSFASESRLQVL